MHWRTDNDLPGSPEDAPVTDSIALSGQNSLAFVQTVQNIVGGPANTALLLGYHVNGALTISWSMFIPDERGANFVLLHGEDISSSAPAAVVSFTPFTNDTVYCDVNGTTLGGTYPHNTWFRVEFSIDLDSGTASFLVNHIQLGSWDFATMPSGTAAPNTLGAVQFIAGSGWDFTYGQYYLDDILFQEGTVGINEVAASRPLAMAPNPTASSTVLSMDMPASDAQVEVHDASGRMVLQTPWPAGSNRYTLPAGALAPGAYVLRVASRASGSLYTGRLVVVP